MPLRGRACLERTEIASPTRLRIGSPGIEAVVSRVELSDHDDSLRVAVGVGGGTGFVGGGSGDGSGGGLGTGLVTGGRPGSGREVDGCGIEFITWS